jgi:hypothetical protein
MLGTTTLIDGDLHGRALVAHGVHQPRRLQREQAGLLDLHARVGDPLADHALVGQRLAERHPVGDPRHISSSARSAAPIVRMQWWMRPGPEAPWAISKPRPSPSEQVLGRHAHVGEGDLAWPCGWSW